MTKITLVILISILFLACEKPNLEPEKLDPIYSDLLNEAKSVEGQIKTTEKDLEGFKKDFAAAVPQTGQIKFAAKRVYETENRLEKLKQMKSYWESRAESRVKWARTEYLKAYKKKESWPPKTEYEEYQLQRKLEMAPRAWNNKQRIEESQLGLNIGAGKPPAGEHGEEKPAHSEH